MTADPSAVTDRSRLRVERLLSAPVEEVFFAWTDAEVMARWLSPTGHAEVEADVRVGGSIRVVMIDGDTRIEHTGEYVEVDPPRRLSFTWRSPYTGDAPSLVTVALTPRGRDTHLVLAHERLPETTLDSHADGWRTILENLAAVLGAARRPE